MPYNRTPYSKTTWVNVADPSNPPPGAADLSAENLNKIEEGIRSTRESLHDAAFVLNSSEIPEVAPYDRYPDAQMSVMQVSRGAWPEDGYVMTMRRGSPRQLYVGESSVRSRRGMNSSKPAWRPATAYSVGALVRPGSENGDIYQCVVAGTSGSTEPAWSRSGDIQDGGVTWRFYGSYWSPWYVYSGQASGSSGLVRETGSNRLLYSNADRLLRGLLYTKASPFTQSFTFSGDGTRRGFKIPRSAVNQKGFVRGGVTATVNGSSAPGTFVKETQTFTFDTAPPAGTNNVVITATDVVPYQGMGVLGDRVEFLDHLPYIFATSYGSGGAWTQPKGVFYNEYPPTALLLPGYNANDDLLLCDTLDNATFRSDFPFNHFPVSSPHVNTPWIYQNYHLYPDFTLVQKSAGVQEPDRGRSLNRSAGLLYSRFAPTATVPQVRFGIYLAKVTSTGTGSALSVGELVLCVVTSYLTTTAGSSVHASPSENIRAADLFRLHGGPVMEE